MIKHRMHRIRRRPQEDAGGLVLGITGQPFLVSPPQGIEQAPSAESASLAAAFTGKLASTSGASSSAASSTSSVASSSSTPTSASVSSIASTSAASTMPSPSTTSSSSSQSSMLTSSIPSTSTHTSTTLSTSSASQTYVTTTTAAPSSTSSISPGAAHASSHSLSHNVLLAFLVIVGIVILGAIFMWIRRIRKPSDKSKKLPLPWDTFDIGETCEREEKVVDWWAYNNAETPEVRQPPMAFGLGLHPTVKSDPYNPFEPKSRHTTNEPFGDQQFEYMDPPPTTIRSVESRMGAFGTLGVANLQPGDITSSGEDVSRPNSSLSDELPTLPMPLGFGTPREVGPRFLAVEGNSLSFPGQRKGPMPVVACPTPVLGSPNGRISPNSGWTDAMKAGVVNAVSNSPAVPSMNRSAVTPAALRPGSFDPYSTQSLTQSTASRTPTTRVAFAEGDHATSGRASSSCVNSRSRPGRHQSSSMRHDLLDPSTLPLPLRMTRESSASSIESSKRARSTTKRRRTRKMERSRTSQSAASFSSVLSAVSILTDKEEAAKHALKERRGRAGGTVKVARMASVVE